MYSNMASYRTTLENVYLLSEIGCNNNSINERALLACMKYCVNLKCKNRKQLHR